MTKIEAKTFLISNWPLESKIAAQKLALDLRIHLNELIIGAVDKFVEEHKVTQERKETNANHKSTISNC